jgi:hypothetical protein
MNECECDTPKEFADPRKRFCRVCDGFVSRSSEEIGRLHTKMDAAIHSLGLDEDELRLFIRKLNDTVSVDVKHKYGTWSHNRAVERSGVRT